jgi:hypothetical protein
VQRIFLSNPMVETTIRYPKDIKHTYDRYGTAEGTTLMAEAG